MDPVWRIIWSEQASARVRETKIMGCDWLVYFYTNKKKLLIHIEESTIRFLKNLKDQREMSEKKKIFLPIRL